MLLLLSLSFPPPVPSSIICSAHSFLRSVIRLQALQVKDLVLLKGKESENKKWVFKNQLHLIWDHKRLKHVYHTCTVNLWFLYRTELRFLRNFNCALPYLNIARFLSSLTLTLNFLGYNTWFWDINNIPVMLFALKLLVCTFNLNSIFR